MSKKAKQPAGNIAGKKSLAYKILLWGLSIFLVFVVSLIGIAAFYEKGIGALVINELKKSLKTELEVESAELSLIWSFPKASVTLKNVKLKGLEKKNPRELLSAEGISLRCSMLGLIFGSYKFDQIEIKNAKLFVYQDINGLVNYDVFKSENEQTESTKLDLSILNAKMTDVSLEYIDEKLKHKIKIKISTSSFSGNFTDDRYDLDSKSTIITENISIGDDEFLKNKELSYNAVIDINNKTKRYNIKKLELTVEGNKFETEGNFSLLKEGFHLDISMESDKARLGSLIKLLPASFEANLGGFESNANLNFDAKFNGLYSANSLPKSDIKFGLKNGRVTHPLLAGYIKEVSFDVSFNHKGGSNKRDGIFKLDNFKAELGGNPIDLKMTMTGTQNPLIDFTFNGIIPMKSVYGFFGTSASKGQGNIKIDELALKGNLEDIINPRKISRVELSGAMSFDNAGIVMNDVPLVFKEGNIELRDNVLSIKNLQLKSKETDMLMEGSFRNLLPVLFSDSTNSRQAELGFEATIKSGKIDADELMEAFTTKAERPGNSELTKEEFKDSIAVVKNEKREFVTQFLNGTIKAEAAEIKYGKIVARDFKGQLVFENNILKIMGVRADVFKGNVGLNAKVFFEKETQFLAFFDCEKVNMYDLLEETDNFGQTTLTSKNLRGSLNSIVKINAFWDSTGTFLDKKLNVIADVTLTKGELIDFELMKSLGKYVKMKDLERIKFNELKNQFIIENRSFIIPAMFIQSNAINLTMGGKHSFDQDFDYKFKINAGQVVAQKMKKHNPNLAMIPAKQKGIFNIYCTVSGNVTKEQYNYKVGKKHGKKQLASDLKTDSNQLSNVLKAEFEKSDLFRAANSVVDPANITKKISKVSEPEDWDDIPDGKEEDFIEGF
jgi:hypothetical protein